MEVDVLLIPFYFYDAHLGLEVKAWTFPLHSNGLGLSISDRLKFDPWQCNPTSWFFELVMVQSNGPRANDITAPRFARHSRPSDASCGIQASLTILRPSADAPSTMPLPFDRPTSAAPVAVALRTTLTNSIP